MGQHLETIPFDASYWQKLEENLTGFSANYLASAQKLSKRNVNQLSLVYIVSAIRLMSTLPIAEVFCIFA